MSALEFISSIVGSLAWPAVAIAIVVLMKSPLSGLISGPVKRWKAGPSGLEVEYWEKQISEARRDLQESPDFAGVEKSVVGPSASLIEELRRLAELSPQAAVMESMIQVEQRLRDLAERVDPATIGRPVGATQLAKVAHRGRLIGDETLEAVQGMAVLRNLVAHGRAEDLTFDKALDFVSLADAVLFALQVKTSGQPGP